MALAVALTSSLANAGDPESFFADQSHHQLVYDFVYQTSLVDRMIFECTADREVSGSFAVAAASVSDPYFEHVLGPSAVDLNPFSDQGWIRRQWQDFTLNIWGSTTLRGDPADPFPMAQRDALLLFESSPEERESICDYTFWEEVGLLETVVDDLLSDAENRLDPDAHAAFMQRSEEGLPLLRRLFEANPFRVVPEPEVEEESGRNLVAIAIFFVLPILCGLALIKSNEGSKTG